MNESERLTDGLRREDWGSVEGIARQCLARLEAAELELERAHHRLDHWGVEREVEGESGRALELSLDGRLQLFEENMEFELDSDVED